MLSFLPLLVFLLLVAAWRCGRSEDTRALREVVLRAALAAGVAIGLGTELLGAFHAITLAGVLIFWLAALSAASAFLAWRWRHDGPPVPIRLPRLERRDQVLLGGVAAVALLTLVVAWYSPPQSSDSLSYHMGRIMHWIQNRSLEPYPTYDTRQLFDPPFAEMVRLHLFLLGGGDRAGCLLQWFAAMGCLAAATLIARDLGGSRRAQVFAAVFAVTLPIGITQATSGKNDWVEALWLLALVYFSGLAGPRRGRQTSADVLAAGAALGLALDTKLMSLFVALPIAAAAILRTPRAAWRRRLLPAVAGGLLAALLIAPFMRRNFQVFGNPSADPAAKESLAIARVTPATVLSNAVRNLAFQMGTPSFRVNAALARIVEGSHRLLGLDSSDPDTTVGRFFITKPLLIEEVAGNPLHVFVFVGVIVALAVFPRRLGRDGRFAYLLSLAAGYLVFCAVVRWQPPNVRLLLPLAVLTAPLVAVVLTESAGDPAILVLAAVLFFGSRRYVLTTYARPLSFSPGRGVLATPRTDLYFARVPGLEPAFKETARVVEDRGVRKLGVVFTDLLQPEYLLWVVTRETNLPLRIENVQVSNASASLESNARFRDFRPDLIVAFDRDPNDPHFEPELTVAGTSYRLFRSFGSAGFYAARPPL